MFKRVFSLILALVLFCVPLLGGAGTVSAASATEDMESLIEKQVRAFADSIDQNKADANAATALAKHGITGGGKTLKAGKSHALTATLFNSELLQNLLTDACTGAIQYMQRFALTSLPQVRGGCSWYGVNSDYSAYVFKSAVSHGYEDRDFLMLYVKPYNGKLNAYDNALDWMVADTVFTLKLEQSKITATEKVYKVTCTVSDRFDFHTSSDSGFKNLISGIGAVLFKEFDWESTVSFELKVPYSCTHSSGTYRWTYDAVNCTFTSDDSGSYMENGTTRYSYENTSGVISYYHELDNPVRLYHDEPWVLEYDIKKPGTFALAPLDTSSSSTLPTLMNRGRYNLWVQDYAHLTVSDTIVKKYGLIGANQYVRNFYGTALNTLFTYNTKNIYTLRLENEIKANGSNMIYLTVHNADTGELLLDKVPMDDSYQYESWIKEYEPKGESGSWLSGKDLFINYIGNKNYRFSADHFELRIWENGEDIESKSYYNTKVTKPTCTAQGYTTYTCSHCGYSYQGDKVTAKGHSFGEWSGVTAPACTETGEEQRTCKTCKEVETRVVAAKGHDYQTDVTAPTCTEPGYTTFTCACGHSYVGDDTAPLGHSFEGNVCTVCGEVEYAPGDADLDDDVDVDDVLALLWNVLFPEDYPIEMNADFDGNGTTDVDDVLALLWFVLFPEDYPLN